MEKCGCQKVFFHSKTRKRKVLQDASSRENIARNIHKSQIPRTKDPGSGSVLMLYTKANKW